jgi:hypothetical protein
VGTPFRSHRGAHSSLKVPVELSRSNLVLVTWWSVTDIQHGMLLDRLPSNAVCRCCNACRLQHHMLSHRNSFVLLVLAELTHTHHLQQHVYPYYCAVSTPQNVSWCAVDADCSSLSSHSSRRHQPDLQKARALGDALTLFSTVPWTLCALVYSFLHCTYPR